MRIRTFTSQFPRDRLRGIAVLSALLAISLLLCLLTAVIGGRRSQGDVVRFDKNDQLANESALSILEYCRYQLERDQKWLADGPLTITPPRDGEDRLMFVVDDISRNVFFEEDSVVQSFSIEVEGRVLLAKEVPFELTINNNFSRDEVTADVLPHYATLDVRTHLGASQIHYFSTLKNAPFANSTVAANGDISIKTAHVSFETLDPHRNQVRSKQDVFLPEVEQMLFQTERNWQRSEKGTVWAYGDILVGEEDDPLPLEEAEEETGARFIPNGRQSYSVPRLGAEQVSADPELDEIINFPSGNYTIGRRTLFFEDTSGSSHEKVVPLVLAGSGDVYFHQEFLEEGLPPVDMSTVRLGEDAPPLSAHPQPTPSFSLGPAKIILSADPEQPCALEVPSNKKIVSEGHLKIVGTSPEDLPELRFVDPPLAEKSTRGHLQVSTGDLTLACSVKNAGLLMASNDVNLQPSDIAVSASVEEDVAIYAGRDVNIDASLANPSIGHATSGGRKLTFRGLVYAGNDFTFDTDSGLSTPSGDPIDYNRDLEVIGSVVAQGEMRMRGTQGATLRYDPEFLNNVMEKSVRGSSKRLEVVSTLEL